MKPQLLRSLLVRHQKVPNLLSYTSKWPEVWTVMLQALQIPLSELFLAGSASTNCTVIPFWSRLLIVTVQTSVDNSVNKDRRHLECFGYFSG